MSTRAKKIFLMAVVALSLNAVVTIPVSADSYQGKLDSVQVRGNDFYFFIKSKDLRLYATGEYRDVLVHAFFKKANLGIGYTPKACPAGVPGACGTVYVVAVSASSF